MYVYIVSQVRYIKGYGDMYDPLYTYISSIKAELKCKYLEERVDLEGKKGYRFEVLIQEIIN